MMPIGCAPGRATVMAAAPLGSCHRSTTDRLRSNTINPMPPLALPRGTEEESAPASSSSSSPLACAAAGSPTPDGAAEEAAPTSTAPSPPLTGAAADGPAPAAAAPDDAAVGFRLAGLMTPYHRQRRFWARRSAMDWSRRWVSLRKTMSRPTTSASHSTYAHEARVRPPMFRLARRMT